MKKTMKSLVSKAIKNSKDIKGGDGENDDILKNLGGAVALKELTINA